MRPAVRRPFAALLLASLAATPLRADDVEPGRVTGVIRQGRFTGDWLGWRPRLLDRGIDLVLVYTGETWSTLHGGRTHHTRYLDNVDLILDADLERLVGWTGARAVIYGLGNHGGSPSEDVGDAQIVSNVDAPDAWKVYEAWLDQTLWHDRLSLRAGLYNLNSEFYVNDHSAMFVNSSFGIGTDFSQSGRNGPSIFPTTSTAARLLVRPGRGTYVQTAVLDGVAGDPRDPQGTRIIWQRDGGVLLVGEVGWLRGTTLPAATKLAAGAWGYTAKLDTIGTTPERRHGSHGAYGLAEHVVWREGDDSDQGLAAFVRGGWADPRFNPFGGFVGGGVVYTGLIPTRDGDRLGLAVACALGGRDFRRASAEALSRAETAIELAYRLEPWPWLALQPDLQYVADPSLSRSIPNALAVALRFRILL